MTESDVSQIMKELQKVGGKVDSIHQGLYGLPNTEDKGMCGKLNDVCKDYYEFKRRIIFIIAFASGSGALGFGIFKIAGG